MRPDYPIEDEMTWRQRMVKETIDKAIGGCLIMFILIILAAVASIYWITHS